MKKAAAIVTNRGGRTCHAAIVSRELGVPAIVGTETGTTALCDRPDRDRVVRRGRNRLRLRRRAAVRRRAHRLCTTLRARARRIMMNVGESGRGIRAVVHSQRRRGPGAPRVHHHQRDRRPSDGAGPIRRARAARREARSIASPPAIPTSPRSSSTSSPKASPSIAAAFYPEGRHRAAERLQDERVRAAGRRSRVRTDGGEPDDRLPRRVALLRRPVPRGLRARVPALKRVRDEMGLTNVKVMVPFCRTVEEARLRRGRTGAQRPDAARATDSSCT